ncbi:lantibiotic dehydratase [Mucilaginibacter sp. OK098]|uniref:lantibiotic dehydratase n=1 Tax=Mucilaginibacter sp. OK098 TaxID=1855297 RepID=UPI0009171FBE|nr:lantibiotic dehydratase [Mucilaginibacter sp. OK098]SHN33725.1 thiopeptide-type bacteriocin biosynthesis domain-containing protein [Mucilaginibacter sp. OK098]
MPADFFSELVLRTPAFPINKYAASVDKIDDLLLDELFMDAVAIASPDLFESCEKLKNGQITDSKKALKIKVTLLKYLNRICYRPTPFGAFASCSTLHWGGSKDIVIDELNMSFHISLDTLFLCQLIEKLELEFKPLLSYRLNSSIYKAGNEYRFYYQALAQGSKKYKVNAIDATNELDKVYELCLKDPIPYEVIIGHICEQSDYANADVVEFVNDLIDAQVLVSALEPRLSDSDPLLQLINVLVQCDNTNSSKELSQTISKLKNFNSGFSYSKSEGPISRFLFQKEMELHNLFNLEKQGMVFQVSSYKPLSKGVLDETKQLSLNAAIHACHILSNAVDPWLDAVKEKIRQKLDSKPIALAHLFDPDLGITDPTSKITVNFEDDILDELNPFASPAINYENNTAARRLIVQFFNSKFNSNKDTNLLTIHISPDELAKLAKKVTPYPLPATFPVMFKLIKDEYAQLLIESAGGHSGTTLLGRFGNENDVILQLLKDITQFEKAANTEVQMASVTHLPETRTGNVLKNPNLRELEIPYLSGPAANAEKQLRINDLIISYRNNKLVLYSQKSGKQVIPKIDNAHNFMTGSLPVYRLLAALQNQFNVGGLNPVFKTSFRGLTFFPRIQYDNVILQSAQLQLNENDLDEFRQAGTLQQQIEAFDDKCKLFGLSGNLLWVEGDQTIFLKRDDIFSFELFFKEMLKKKEVILREFFEPDETVKDSNGLTYNHQFITVVKNNIVRPGQTTSNIITRPNAQRNFYPGSEWCYVKIYCSVFFSNDFLVKLLSPLLKTWIDEGKIDTWFFIRYKDPEDHIRLRFHLAEPDFFNTLFNKLNSVLDTYQQQGFISRITIDTYERELERYNLPDYFTVEKLFRISSDLCIQILACGEFQTQGVLPLLGIKSIDDMYNNFSLSAEKKYDLALKSSLSFQNEIVLDEEEKKIQLDYYHSNLKQIRMLIENAEEVSAIRPYLPYFLESEKMYKKLKLSEEIHASDEIISSLVHMHFNRLYNDNQRIFEMICYSVIAKYYKSKLR